MNKVQSLGIILLGIAFGLVGPVLAVNGWTPVSREQAEREAIMNKIRQIQAHYQRVKSQLAGMGSNGFSSAFQAQDTFCQRDIFNLLKSIGTPVSYQILQEMCANGQLPKDFLNKA